MTERQFATEVVEHLQRHGYQALWAGGCVRDEQIGLHPADYDIATSARPEQVQSLFKRCHAFGASFGVVEVLGPKYDHGEWLKVQVATFRSDGTYSDGRRPDQVIFSSPEEDAKRRDFTVNGLFYDPITHQVIDYVGGLADLQAKVLRAIGNPFERFQEDKLRLLRAVRMATRFELAIDPETQRAAQQMAAEIQVVSAERIAEELRKLLVHRHRVRGLQLLFSVGLFERIFPELTTQVPERLQALFEAVASPVTFELALACLISDAGEEAAEHIALKLKLSNDERRRIIWLVRQASVLDHAQSLTPAQLYPLLVEPGIQELLALHEARQQRDQIDPTGVQHCRHLLMSKQLDELNPPPLVNGVDLQQWGYRPGPRFKELLQEIRDRQLNGLLHSRDDVQAWIKSTNSRP